ncbi:hypothetical protein [Mesorhizobium sp. 131-2-1]|uniref:hypothetical protein n=1 Tax=Mesorhizobium sp. 131-2-1 TaxID=2744518 RepID=UPI00192698A2|nr:hypothetical protein [Mesorhizobium sp. 131-2-1]BCG94358.1 hypothetical protein MesoLj131a_32220 [Mesorhizobium sp. 131-2-1]
MSEQSKVTRLSAVPANSLITETDIDRAYDACAILRVCELAIDPISGLGQDALVNQAIGDVGRLLRIAGQTADRQLELLEWAKRRQLEA